MLPACIHTCTYVCTYVRMYLRTYIHTYIHAYIQTVHTNCTYITCIHVVETVEEQIVRHLTAKRIKELDKTLSKIKEEYM